MTLRDKKGAEKILAMYWFIILMIIAGGVFAMVYNFHNQPYDIREIESNLMINHVADCVSTGGQINPYVFEEGFKENFLEVCSLNFETEDFFEATQYYLKLNLGSQIEVEEGNKNLVSSCGIEKEIEGERLARCIERSFYSLDSTGNEYLIKILSIVRKTEKNVK